MNLCNIVSSLTECVNNYIMNAEGDCERCPAGRVSINQTTCVSCPTNETIIDSTDTCCMYLLIHSFKPLDLFALFYVRI